MNVKSNGKLDVKKTILTGFGFLATSIAWAIYDPYITKILNKILSESEFITNLSNSLASAIPWIGKFAEAQGQKLQQQELEFNNYAAQKEQEIQEEQMVMMNQLGDAIQTFLNKYNEEKQYAMILTNSGGAPVITADAALDITDDVLAGLNEEYIKSKNNK